jgi:hypothetical protein
MSLIFKLENFFPTDLFQKKNFKNNFFYDYNLFQEEIYSFEALIIAKHLFYE